ncbi:A/G-specific adenine glycosylase [Lacticaseibacillus baoqingensis]|uniref:Adenine DNA glycosylase n=1 Tax=Lacticaseibacillus baoqingensis TaxID=2486013 RepID=A0ABW4EA67_9LACO|nr:A/G-specific adenine glycosylase [Lacticaseibacillus baoqingensis]
MWKEEKIKAFRRTLLAWYDANKRDLPWRVDRNAYHVLVSELMLQQTQVQTVIPYYQRFITQMPTVQALADAPEAQVMKAWEGLGYYSRARNLQKAAKQLIRDYGGVWPHTVQELQQLAGIGPYTAGAIASIAFDQVEPAIDGNAFRVFARLFCIPDDIAQPKTRAVFDRLIRQVIDPKRPGDFNQAIMDLGASYMSAKDPDPKHSPVAAFDASWQTGRVLDFPVKTKKKRPKPVPYYAIAVHSPAGYLFVQRPSTGMLANLWMFPLVARSQLEPDTVAQAALALQARVGTEVALQDPGLPLVKHTFTHQQWQMTLLVAEAPAFALDYVPGRWVQLDDLAAIAIPTVQKKLLKGLPV